jgi:hypothetical protein
MNARYAYLPAIGLALSALVLLIIVVACPSFFAASCSCPSQGNGVLSCHCPLTFEQEYVPLAGVVLLLATPVSYVATWTLRAVLRNRARGSNLV